MFAYWVHETLEVITACYWAANGNLPYSDILPSLKVAFIEDSERF